MTLDPRTGQTDPFPCPWCGEPLQIWRETFKGGGTVHVRASHIRTASDNCKADAMCRTDDEAP